MVSDGFYSRNEEQEDRFRACFEGKLYRIHGMLMTVIYKLGDADIWWTEKNQGTSLKAWLKKLDGFFIQNSYSEEGASLVVGSYGESKVLSWMF